MLLLRTIQTHTSHAVLLCYGCVLMRKLCHLSIEATELFVHNGILFVLTEALDRFPEDAILQASACGCLAVLAQSSNTSKNLMLQANASELSVIELVLNSLAVHSEYSNLTRQVQIYSCEGRQVLGERFSVWFKAHAGILCVHVCGAASADGAERLRRQRDFGGHDRLCRFSRRAPDDGVAGVLAPSKHRTRR